MGSIDIKQVQNYAQTNGVDIKTAAKALGLNEQEATELQNGLSGNGNEYLDGFHNSKKIQRKPTKEQKEEKSFWKKWGGPILGAAGTIAAGAIAAGKVAAFTPIPGARLVAGGLFLLGLGATVASCSDDEPIILNSTTNNNVSVDVSVTIPKENQDKLIEAMNKNFAELKAVIEELKYNDKEHYKQIIALLTKQDSYLQNIAKDLEENNKNQEKILEIITNMNNTVERIEDLIENTNENITVNGINLQKELQNILKAIKNISGSNTETQINANLVALQELLKNVIQNQGDQITLEKNNNTTLEKILEQLNDLDGKDMQTKLAAILEVLGSIESIGKEINGKLDQVLNKMDEIKNALPDNKNIEASLAKIEKYLQENNDKTDVTNNLLSALLARFQSGALSEDELQKILDAIGNNGNKIDVTNQILAELSANFVDKNDVNKILDAIAKLDANNTQNLSEVLNAIKNLDKNVQMNFEKYINKVLANNNENTGKILEAIAKLDASNKEYLAEILTSIKSLDSNTQNSLEKLLNDVLANNNANTGKILEAISKVEVNMNGNINLDDIKQMLTELIALSKGNNNLLQSIDSKLGVLNLTAKSIEQKLDKEFGKNDERYVNIMNLLKAISNKVQAGGDKYDDTKLMNKLDLLLSKLDEIKQAIKDHKVTVDITGKVECHCNCGGNHEGILGDLEDILG